MHNRNLAMESQKLKKKKSLLRLVTAHFSICLLLNIGQFVLEGGEEQIFVTGSSFLRINSNLNIVPVYLTW